MGIDLGTGPLGTALQGGLGLQEVQQRKQAGNQEAIEKAGAPIAAMAGKAAENQLDMVTITPQIAAGLKKSTGDDSWDRAVGTKWKSNVFTAMVAAQSQAKYHNDLMGNRELLEQMRDAAKEKDTQITAKSREKASKITAEARVEAAFITAGGKGSKTDKTYLTAAKDFLNLAKDRRKTLTDVLADDASKKEAQDWLTSHAADIKKAEDAESSTIPDKPKPGAKPPAAAADSSGSDKAVPLDQSGGVDGLDPLGIRGK